MWLGSQYCYQTEMMNFTVHLGVFHSFLCPQRHCRKLMLLPFYSWYMRLKLRLSQFIILVPQIFTLAAYLLLQPAADTKRAFWHNTPSCKTYAAMQQLLGSPVQQSAHLASWVGQDTTAIARIPKVMNVHLYAYCAWLLLVSRRQPIDARGWIACDTMVDLRAMQNATCHFCYSFTAQPPWETSPTSNTSSTTRYLSLKVRLCKQNKCLWPSWVHHFTCLSYEDVDRMYSITAWSQQLRWELLSKPMWLLLAWDFANESQTKTTLTETGVLACRFIMEARFTNDGVLPCSRNC